MLLLKEEQRNAFVDTLVKQQNEEITSSKNDTKYVIFRPIEAGFGNSMIVFVESILFAYFSKRHFYSTFNHSYSP